MVFKTKLHFNVRIEIGLFIGRNVTKHDLNAKIYKCGFEKLHIHETSFIFFKHLIEESFFPEYEVLCYCAKVTTPFRCR